MSEIGLPAISFSQNSKQRFSPNQSNPVSSVSNEILVALPDRNENNNFLADAASNSTNLPTTTADQTTQNKSQSGRKINNDTDEATPHTFFSNEARRAFIDFHHNHGLIPHYPLFPALPADEEAQVSTLYRVIQRNSAYPPIMSSGHVWTSDRPFKDIFCTNGPSWAIGNSFSEESDYKDKNSTTSEQAVTTTNQTSRRGKQQTRHVTCQHESDTCDRRYVPPAPSKRDAHNRDLVSTRHDKMTSEARQEQRFHMYATVGMRDICYYPIPRETFDHIQRHLSSTSWPQDRRGLVTSTTSVTRSNTSIKSTTGIFDQNSSSSALIRHMQREVEQLFDQSIRTATVDYILASPYEQSRMALLPLARFPDHSQQFLSPEMHQNSFDEARKQMCQILFAAHPLLITLQQDWNQRNDASKSHQQDIPFVVLDFNHTQLNNNDAIEPDQFQQHIRDATQKFRTRIVSEWVNFVHSLYKTNRHTWSTLIKASAASKFHRIEAFFNATATLMARQLLVLVQQAKNQLIEKFRLYEKGNNLSSDNNNTVSDYSPTLFGHYPLFRLTVDVSAASRDDETVSVTVSPHAKRLEEILDSCFDYIMDAVRNVPRVENLIFQNMKRIVPRFLDVESLFQTELREAVVEAKTILHANLVGPPLYLQQTYFDKFLNFLTKAEDDRIKAFLSVNDGTDRFIELELIEAEVAKLDATMNEMRQLPNQVNLNLFVLDCSQLNQRLTARVEALRARLIDYVVKMDRAVIKQVSTQFEDMAAKAGEMPEAVRDLVALGAYLKNCQVQIFPQLFGLIQFVADNLVFLYSTTYVATDDVASHTHLFLWPQNIQSAFQVSEQRIMHRRMQAEDAIRRRAQTVNDTLELLRSDVIAFDKREFTGANEDLTTNVVQLDDIAQRVQALEDETHVINDEEKLLNFEPSFFPTIHELRAIKQPYDSLWRNALEYQERYDYWMARPFVSLLSSDVESTCVRIADVMYDLIKSFGNEVPAARRVAETFKKRIDVFRQYMPLLTAISNPALQLRHWKDVQIILGRELPLKPESTLHDAIDWGLYSEYDKVGPILNKVWEELAAERRVKEEQEAKLEAAQNQPQLSLNSDDENSAQQSQNNSTEENEVTKE